jgi:3-hydroxyacyl-CoA dehydrogenase
MTNSPITNSAQQYLQLAQQQAGKGQEWPPLPLDHQLIKVGVVGAGTMGAGIAQAAAKAGMQTWLMDIDANSLQNGLQRIRTSLSNAVQRNQLSAQEEQAAWGNLHGTQSIEDLTDADVVIEAVYEDLNLKSRVLAQLGVICQPKTLLTSNTSTLDIDHLAQASGRADQFVGTHFLTPAHIVPLVEVVRGQRSSPEALALAGHLVTRMGKTPIQTSNAWGFIGNRLFEAYLKEADALVLAGIPPQRIDTALQSFGMAMGPCRTVDMAGLDIADQVITERAKALPQGYPPTHRVVTRRLAEMGRLGVKSGRGHYLYQGKTPCPDTSLDELLDAWRKELGIKAMEDLSDQEIVQRCIDPLIEEGQRVLREGVALRESDIDLVWVVGYGFPASLGGPMRMSHQIKRAA